MLLRYCEAAALSFLAYPPLRVRNVQAREPLVKHLDGDLWELREESNTNIYRVIYCCCTGRCIVFLHGFQKKRQQTPRREPEQPRFQQKPSS